MEESIDEALPHFAPPDAFAAKAWVKTRDYDRTYPESVANHETFWAKEAKERIHWFSPFQKTYEGSFVKGENRWFVGGKTNVSYNCLDRHLDQNGDKLAIRWIGNQPAEERTLTYRQLHQQVVTFAASLKRAGVRKGDRVILYMPMVPEAAVAMLATVRIGAVHSIVFGGFSAKSLFERVQDSGATFLITADEGPRGTGRVLLKQIVDEALEMGEHQIRQVVVLKRTGATVTMKEGRDIGWDAFTHNAPTDCPAEPMDAEDPLFILYTSGSTGRPKGLLHTTGGYLTYVTSTFRWVFDIKPSDLYWCTADVGWITGHSYIVYGPLSNASSVLMFEGVPSYPNAGRFWEIIEKYRVTIFYTAPTALRALMKLGDEWITKRDLSSLRLLGSVGEPINPKAWLWYHQVVGKGKLPIVDTWWQTETGGVMISPLPGATTLIPGLATKPIFGIEPMLLDPESAKQRTGETSGALVIAKPWPGMARTIYGDHQRFVETYFKPFAGYYTTGDGAERDSNGNYRITGRMDDVINVSGHRLGTFEIESALVSHPSVAEAAVIGIPHDIKGQSIYAYVTLKDSFTYDEALRGQLIAHVRKEIGPIATPERIHWAPALPKTRSGKIMRRILRKIAVGELDNLGDTSTLADPKVVDDLLADRA